MHGRYAESVFSPHHLINYIHISLNDANHLHGHGLVHIIGAGLAQNTLLLHLNGHIGGIEQFPSGDAGKDKVTSFQCLGAFRAGADTHGSDGVTDGQVEARLLG